MARSKYKYVLINQDVAVGGKKLADMTEKELREMYESGDTRHIERQEKEPLKTE
jgi:hypothetical protein